MRAPGTKLDGYRALIVKEQRVTTLLSRRGNNLNLKFPTIGLALCQPIPLLMANWLYSMKMASLTHISPGATTYITTKNTGLQDEVTELRRADLSLMAAIKAATSVR